MRKILLTVVSAMALAIPASASAQGLPTQTIGYAKTVGVTHIQKGGKQARLTVRYSCTKGNHLWVSLKQSANGHRDSRIKGESSGGNKVAKTWLDSHREFATCDGRKRTADFYVDQVEPGKYGKLVHGYAWLQFCVTNSDPNNPNDQGELTTYLPTWVKVR